MSSFDSLDTATWSFEKKTNLLTVSTGYRNLLGYPNAGPYDNPGLLKQSVHPDDIQLLDEHMDKLFAGHPSTVEHRIVRRTGEVKWVQSIGIPQLDLENKVVRIQGIVLDITERKTAQERLENRNRILETAEEELLRSEQRYRSLFEYNSDVICELDLAGNVVDINPTAERVTGERLLGADANFSIVDVFGPDKIRLMTEYFEMASQGNFPLFEMTSRHKNGNAYYWEMKMVPIYVNDRIEGAFVICKDITAKKSIEKELAERESQYRLIADNMMDMMSVLDPNGKILFASPSCGKVLGCPAESFKDAALMGFIHPDDIEYLRDEMRGIVQEKSNRLLRYRILHANGSHIHLESLFTPVCGIFDEVESIVAVARDISEKAQIEKELMESEGRYRNLIELSPQPMISHRDGKFVCLNPAGLNLLGAVHADEVVGKTVYEIVHPDYRDMAVSRARSVMDKRYIGSAEYKIIRFDGQVIEVESTEIYNELAATTLILLTDITERKKMERALQESEERYRRLVELSPVAIAIYKESKITYLNPAGVKMLGAVYNGDTVETDIIMDWVHPDYRDSAVERMANTLLNGYCPPGEFQIIHLDGHAIDISLISIYDSQSSSIQLMFEDITARKQTERALLESEDRHFRLQTSLDRFSHDLFGVMKVSQLERRLVKEVREVMKSAKVSLIEDEHNNDKLCEIIETEKGYYLKIGEIKGKSYLLCIDEKPITFKITSQRVWLQTIARYVSVLFDNFLLIEDLTKELEQTAGQQVAPTWLLRLLFNLSENERKRLSQDLHDAALQEQIIWYRKLDLLLTDEFLTEDIRDQLGQIMQGLLDVVYQIRITCNELRPPMLKEEGLTSSLEALFDLTQLRTNYSIQFDACQFDHALNDDLLIGLYRIVQELLANATKHSYATEVRIALSSQCDNIQLGYEDNGVGMDLGTMKDSFNSMGIYGIKERVRSMNGTIEFRSSKNNGLAISITIPAHG